MNYRDWKQKAADRLRAVPDYQGIEEYWLQSELDDLAAALLYPESDRSHAVRELSGHALAPETVRVLDEALEQLLTGKPLALITGFTWFAGVRILCLPDVLVPRPDSETLVLAAGELLQELRPEKAEVLELCCGSACLSLGLLHFLRAKQSRTTLRITCTDLSPQAVEAAKTNVAAQGSEEVIAIERADLWPSRLLTGEIEPLLTIANPPYLSDAEFIQSGLGQWEPELALAAGRDGLALYRRILDEGELLLPAGSYLLLEHGYAQADAIKDIAAAGQGWKYLGVRVDLAGRARVTMLRRQTAIQQEG